MKFTPMTVTAAVVGILGAATCFAQTPGPAESTTNPSSASSPSQRDATESPATETPAQASEPSDTSTPHQREAMGSKNQTMKECMDAKAAANTSGMSKAEMTQACQDQIKMQKERARMSKAPETTPKTSDGSQTPAPK